MTEQYKDAYQNKYREETAQIHAPLSLIAKTKAAVREEEKRLALAGQGRGASAKSVAAPESELSIETDHANRKKQSWTFSVRKWAYPLTAAATVLILVSVSLTMRGMKSANRLDTASPAAFDGAAESGAVYEQSAESADAGYAESAAGEPVDYETAEAPASEAPAMEAEEPEKAAAGTIMADTAADTAEAETVSEAQNAEGAASSELTNGTTLDQGNAEMAVSEDKLAEELTEDAVDMASQKNAANAQKKEMAGELQRGDADYDDYTIEKVTKRPAGFNGSEVKIRRYEGKTFRVLEMTRREKDSEKAWTAYVEVATGEGYVICGEAESVEDFLAAAYQKLEEGE